MSTNGDEDNKVHQPCRIVLILVTVVVFIFMVLLNGLASWPAIYPGLFHNTTAGVSNAFPVDITPAGWTFIIWIIIYLHQLAIILYILSTFCRSAEEKPLYCKVPFLTPVFFISYTVANLNNMAWLILWDRQLMQYALLTMILLCLSLYLCLFISLRGVFRSMPPFLSDEEIHQELGAIIGIIHNGLGLYAAWVTIAAILNGSIVLKYHFDVPHHIVSSIALNTFTAITVTYFVLDIVAFERFFRMLFTPYLVLLFAITGIMFNKWDLQTDTTITCLSIITIVTGLFITKMLHCFHASLKWPLFETNTPVPTPNIVFVEDEVDADYLLY